MTRYPSRTILTVLVALALALLAFVAVSGPALGATEHCPGEPGGNEFKFNVPEGESSGSGFFDIDGTIVNFDIDGPTVTFTDSEGDPLVVIFCVKAANLASGELTGSEFTVDWLNTGGQTPNISYIVVYGLPDEEETPTPTPAETPAETPGETPAETPLLGGGNPPEQPDTALPFEGDNGVLPLAFGGLLLLGLGGLAVANIAAARRRA